MLSRLSSLRALRTAMPVRAFSSDLSSLLARELAEEKANCFVGEELETLREKVLKHFKITDTPGNVGITLKSKTANEIIDINFNVQDVAEPEAGEYEDEEEEAEGDYEGDEEDDVLPSIRFTARIVKNNEALIFDCVASSILTIDSVMHLEENADEVDNSAYHGPRFIDLENDVQEAFADYLNDRHINDDLANFIMEYADLKEQKEYVTFLENVQKFTAE
ncbi:hypothetical protein SDRG_08254 [Saprolegnia diclina VS20]|uniref:Complement component 1 Q subcomponent-binding protein, mitochondrial n=1 Tax=Saprolegnia diclina (strain VS20) TaxID=1156394 RepID=T0QJW5_SAPDV|nr:hypothetical protein SDRG_08253 [Saprolegnia diclina VS20]XP_008612352.1 hypothetical protein SDRG_08254 [Saprolegnia diclina VS20]EQC34039.1 hypothetical protein SDRG_08253 [Saprolegnia diclina VS20]EQC34040.1 hypothetical protein SDRG_08254 [Saprolegnia diclina VS20]|eukprot:XP_008612351.1 hypothetical protein SDRG_08253 [Saprolegnia diclina VS20]